MSTPTEANTGVPAPASLPDEPATPWDDDLVQFARLISEMEAFGAFGGLSNWHGLFEETDLTEENVLALIERAQAAWEAGKERYAPIGTPCDRFDCGRGAVDEVFNEDTCRTMAVCQPHLDQAIKSGKWERC